MYATALLSLLPFLASANAYFILGQPILETTRLDPIVNPGGIGSHVHTIAGGSNFNATMSFASAQASGCTTATVSVDKSNYWAPSLFYYNPADGSFQLIPSTGMNAYYLPRGPNNSFNVSAFPDGLRMTSGDPNRRTFNSSSFADQAVSFVCLDYSGSHQNDPAWAQRNNFFAHNCPNGLRAQVNFPSCWDGVNLDSANHQSHMAFASGGPNGGGDCPSTHPVHLVTLFYEFFFPVQNFPFNDPSQPTWVLANGDATGYGFHGDFLSGWPSLVNGDNVLQQALNQCNANNGVGGELNNCPPFVPYLNSNSANACRPQNPQVNEDIGNGHSIARLPGNNPLWVGNGTKPSWPGYTDAGIGFTNGQLTIPSGYSLVGCIAEGTSGRALTGARLVSSNMTRGACVSWCQGQGYPLAGIEYAQECYCDFQMRNGATNTTLLDNSKCGMACAGNSNENCGGPGALTLFNNPGMYPTTSLPAGWTATGCQTEASGMRALSGYSFTSNSMTPTLCMTTCQQKGFTLAGAEYSRECYCGNSYNSGSVAANSGDCNMVCSGDNTATCGGPNRLTTWSFSSSSAATAQNNKKTKSRRTRSEVLRPVSERAGSDKK